MSHRTERLSPGRFAVYAAGPNSILLGLVKRVAFGKYQIETYAGNGGDFATVKQAAAAVARVDELATRTLPALARRQAA